MIRPQKGFTLVEAIMVMTITGIIAAVVAVFIVTPVQGYFDSVARAEITDTADTALRRIGRDLRLALPNSVRVTGGNALEFLSTTTGGRYRAAGDGGTDPLEFEVIDGSFAILGPPIAFTATTPTNQNQIVISNLGIPGANAYAGNADATHNRRAWAGIPGNVTSIAIAPAAGLNGDLELGSHRFQVVDTPVSYICDLGAGTLTRYWGYPILTAQPAAAPNNASGALIATNVSGCNFSYSPGIQGGIGLVAMQITLTQNNESVTLYHEVHVTNVP